ncbi:ephrin-A1a isoform X2 [Hippoglossus hippoglossus]|uniref:ephrin-A1a isoform X2 n=1 Tax=Hippoglossus hippoglossus TaxID=8267 RepID=UPI00148D588C|nr:ephrin-A1a isoform X2 [Hippoglossus hippoglossus]
MDWVWIVGFAVSVCAWCASAERHSVYWNSTNPKFLWDDYAVEVKLNDYLDIVCPHYPEGEVPSLDAERYVLYMVELEDYESCKPQSYDQMRWECGHPFAPHAPEKFSEKFQRFTPFTLGKEFRQGESYYYISKPLHHHGQECLRLRVDVVAADGSQEARVAKGGTGGATVGAGGGVHNPSNRLPADDPVVILPDVQKSVRTNSAVAASSLSILSLLVPFSLLAIVALRGHETTAVGGPFFFLSGTTMKKVRGMKPLTQKTVFMPSAGHRVVSFVFCALQSMDIADLRNMCRETLKHLSVLCLIFQKVTECFFVFSWKKPSSP